MSACQYADTYQFAICSCILDGEMLVYDPLLERYLAFGTLKTAALGESVHPIWVIRGS